MVSRRDTSAAVPVVDRKENVERANATAGSTQGDPLHIAVQELYLSNPGMRLKYHLFC